MSVDDLRAVILDLGAQRVFEDIVLEGATFRVLTPTIAQRSQIARDASLGEGATDFALLQVSSVIALVVNPETGKPLFKKADQNALLNLPAGSFFDDLSEVAIKLMNVQKEDMEEVEKN